MELFSPGHLVVLLVIVGVLFFGWKQLPDMARSAGRSMRIFRTEIKGLGDEVKATAAAATGPVSPQPVVAAETAAAPTPSPIVVSAPAVDLSATERPPALN